jgi:hypothetical protein
MKSGIINPPSRCTSKPNGAVPAEQSTLMLLLVRSTAWQRLGMGADREESTTRTEKRAWIGRPN